MYKLYKVFARDQPVDRPEVGSLETMRIGELARLTGLSTSTINFYVQQNLLHRPTKISRTRSLYKRQHLIRLRAIKHLQSQGLSLAVIGRILEQAGTDEQVLERLFQQRGPAFGQEFLGAPPVGLVQPSGYTRAELRTSSGLQEQQLKRLEEWGLLRPGPGRDHFQAAELGVAKAFRRLFELGATDEELDLYVEYLHLQRRFASHLYGHLLRSHRDAWLAQELSGRELSKLSGTVEAYLRFRAAEELFPETFPDLLRGPAPTKAWPGQPSGNEPVGADFNGESLDESARGLRSRGEEG